MKRIIIIVGILIFFGILISSPSPLGNPKSDAHAFETPGTMRADSAAGSIEEDKLVLYLEEVPETMMSPGIEQFFYGNNTTEPSGPQNTEKKSDKERKDAQQELTKVRTKIKCVISVLKNAVIQPYCVNGQIEGLQINSLDEISEAKTLLLKSGDIILAVNGQTLSSKKDAYDIFKKARKEPIMIVDLLQDGEAKKLLLDFQ
jgi:type II secretory pathway component PulC